MASRLLARSARFTAAILSIAGIAASPVVGSDSRLSPLPFDSASLPPSGEPRVLAIGESSHGNEQVLRARNRLILELAEQGAISWVALETGYAEARLLDRFVRGAPSVPEEVARRGFTSGFGASAGNVALLRDLRAVNQSRSENDRIGIIGIDLSLGGPLGSAPTMTPVDCALDGTDDPARREALAAAFAEAIKPGLEGPSVTDEQKAAFRRLSERLQASLAPDASLEARACARIVAQSAAVFDALPSVVTPGSIPSDAWISASRRDEAMAANVLAAFRRSAPGGILVFAHSSHIMTSSMRGGRWSGQAQPPRSMGEVLRDSLGDRYVAIAQIERATKSSDRIPDLIDAFGLTCTEPCIVHTRELPNKAGTAFRIGINGGDEQIIDATAADAFLLIPPA